MAFGSPLEVARDAFGRKAWGEARATYVAAWQEANLSADDLERFATVSHLVGEEDESRELLAEGYRESLQHDDLTRAARFAFWLGQGLMFTGDLAQGGGWLGRARHLLEERGVDCVEWGYLLIWTGMERLEAGDAAEGCDAFTESLAIGRRFADVSLQAMAGHGRGRALIRMALTGEGMAVLDEVMVAVTAGEVSPMVVGDVYCGVLEACHEVFDTRRAREWTAAFSRWCEDQPDMVPYRGPCLVHRVELMRLRGDWAGALEEARRACDWLSSPSSAEGPGVAYYELGELHRLRGDVAAAEEAYREASRLGRRPEPGLPLLWLGLGRVDAASAALQRALEETRPDERIRRAELLAACVEVSLSLGDTTPAEAASAELRDVAAALDAVPVRAMADRATGSVLIAKGDARAALAPLRRSWTVWNTLDAPYEAARVRVLIAAAYRALGDEESAAMEVDAARWVFERLGAAPDLAPLDAGTQPVAADEPVTGLTRRELEVLQLIALGETNKAIAAALVISEHTVARHVQNMLLKLGFASRTSLAAFAVERGLTRPVTGQN
jgi:DNA-binding CsgD family transcriptional regulator